MFKFRLYNKENTEKTVSGVYVNKFFCEKEFEKISRLKDIIIAKIERNENVY